MFVATAWSQQDKRTQFEAQTGHLILETPEVFIQKIKTDRNNYWGEGIANIDKDLGQTKIDAKNRALGDLTQKIEIRIETELTTVLSASADKVVKDEFNEKIGVYTRQVITNVKELYFIDYPKKRILTYIVYIPKSDFERQVSEDLEAKRLSLRQAIIDADRIFLEGQHMAALSGWISAAQAASSFFGRLPLQDDLDNDGTKEDVFQAIVGRTNRLLAGLTISFLNDKPIRYTSSGVLTSKPTIIVQYEKDLVKTGVKAVPVSVDFSAGTGKCGNGYTTGEYGQIDVTAIVDAAKLSSALTARIDVKRIQDLSGFIAGNLPTATLSLSKIRMVALSVFQSGSPDIILLQSLHNDLAAFLTKHGYAHVQHWFPKITPEKSEITSLIKQNIDYVLHVNISEPETGAVGDFKNMYMSRCSGNALVISATTGAVLGSASLPEVKGYGVNKKGAEGDAYGKLRKELIADVESLRGRMQ